MATMAWHPRWFLAALMAALLPAGSVLAQGTAQSFDDLPRVVKVDAIILIVDNTGRERLGRVAEVNPASITVALKQDLGGGRVVWATSTTQAFTAGSVSEVWHSNAAGDRRSRAYAAHGLFHGLEKLTVGQKVIVTDGTGQKTTGRVTALSPSALVMAPNRARAGIERTFAPSSVLEIRRPGPIWDGALKGGGIGILLGALAPDGYRGGAMSFCGTVAAGIGLGIDLLVGPKRIHAAPEPRSAVSVSPAVGPNERGVRVSLRF